MLILKKDILIMMVALYLFPVAKSTEIMMINKTDWELFAEATGLNFR